ncbi:hypothetical protein DIZ76_016139 [Coccidioides immitis]|nr:hypothetical protein DIZ76_016139 [Coccidioides immitis]
MPSNDEKRCSDTIAMVNPELALFRDMVPANKENSTLETGAGSLRVESIDLEVEKRVVKKLDWRVMPLLSALYLLSFLDRTNIGNARIAGMESDLRLNGSQYTWLLTIFYISFIAFQFQGVMWKIIPPHIWATIVVFGWGLFATCQAAVHSWAGEMALRFLLGVAEAGFSTGIPYLLSFFYRRQELGLRCGLFLAAAPVANTFSGALAYAITSGKSKIAPWRLLFLVEGLPTILMAPITFYFLPDSPSKARFLNEEEKKVAEARAVRQVGRVDRVGNMDWKDAFSVLRDVKLWCGVLIYFNFAISYASLPVFLPTLLADMGFTAIDAQGLTAPPFFLAILVTIGTTWAADRLQQRGIIVAILCLVTLIGYVLLAACTSVAARYAGVWIASCGLFAAVANTTPWLLNNQGSDNRRGMLSVVLSLLGQSGTLLGTNVFPDSERPRFIKGQTICAAFVMFNFVIVVGLRTLLVYQNRKLDQKYGTIEQHRNRQHQENAILVVAEEDYGPNFRYVL